MRHLTSVLAVIAVMVALFALTAMPAFAQEVSLGAKASASADASALDLSSLGIDINADLGISL